MIRIANVKELIDDLFEEEALVIGGLAAVHEIDGQVVWRLIKNLDVIRGKVLRRLEGTTPAGAGVARQPREGPTPHPAIEEFLQSLGRT